MSSDKSQAERQPADSVTGEIPRQDAEAPADSSELPGLNQYMRYEEIQEVQSGIAQLLHKMLDVCISLTVGRRTGNGNGN